MGKKTFHERDLVQIKSEYEAGNPSCFRIIEIYDGKAVLGQLDPNADRYIGVHTVIELDDPDLVSPATSILEQYSRHVGK